MRAVLSSLLLTAACVSPELSTHDQAIVGGETVSASVYPSIVALEDRPGGWFCTGTLIASEWVLTAAHCVVDSPTTGMSVRFDDDDVNDTTGGIAVAVAEVHAHPDFDWEAWDNDIALLRLATPVTDRAPTPIMREAVAYGTEVIDVGYGVADNNDNGGGLLRQVTKVTVDCADANDPSVSGANLVCMDASDGRGSCYGDSGGPAFTRTSSGLVVAGITSGGTGEACGAGWDLYTSISAELAFIDATMGPQPQPEPEPEEPMPEEMTPEPQPTDDGGCNASGAQGGLALGLLLLGRRRRQRQ